ncbi:MAG TPA: FAD-binding oxidoreductase [Anaerolineales bacterium]|nr:FAD-binding oxidoreductase [Anaerolineales bacterium]
MRRRREFNKQTLRNEIDLDAINKFRASLLGRLILPADQEYDRARRVEYWNPTTDKHPAMIARCAQADDVARCVNFARQHDLTVAVRSGGHSFLGWGTCDDGLILDVSRMKDIAIDPDKRTAEAGAGVVAQELEAAAATYGLAPILGECPTVGIAGLTLGGGLGWLSGKYGAICDNLLSANLITVDSHAIVASAESNADLFWAIRGGGGNFGIATSFEYRLHPVSEVLAGVFTYPVQEARHVLRFYREFMAAAPDELQVVASLSPRENGVVNVVFVYPGDLNAGNELIERFRAFLTPARDTVQRRPYTEMFPTPAGFVPPAFSSIKGSYLEQLSDEAIDIAVECFAQAPSGCAIGFDHYVHGEVCRVALDSTAFELRASGALHTWIMSTWDDPEAARTLMTWAENTWQLLQPYSGGRVYANYMSVEGEPAVKAAYGSNYSRLRTVKTKFDPDNFLRRNQNVQPIKS